MITNLMTGKAIWREPYSDQIFTISSGDGSAEFIIAPFNKNEKIISIKGAIFECNHITMSAFFNEIILLPTSIKYSTDQAKYIQDVELAINHINNKSFEKVVLARQYFIEKSINLQTLFHLLVEQYKEAFIYCFVLEDGTCMVGATPEILLKKEENSLTTEALGGTAQINGFNEKEYLEHQQIITDISNKLSEQSYSFNMSGTKIKNAGNVSHLSTLFKVDRKNNESDWSLLNTLHPTSAVCGLPFQPAYDFILQHEDFERKYYTGYLGIKTTTDFKFYVNLRCAKIVKNGAILYAGAGISKDSIPENEWLETTNKLDTLRRWI